MAQITSGKLIAFAAQVFLQLIAASQILVFANVPAALVLGICAAAAHLIPTYFAYQFASAELSQVGDESLGKFLKYGVTTYPLTLIFALVFASAVFGIGCQPFMHLVVGPTLMNVAFATGITAALGAALDVFIAALFVLNATPASRD